MKQTYLAIDGREIAVPRGHANPCVKLYGEGPPDKRCKHCAHLWAKVMGNTYYKCDLRANTGGPATDHRCNWPACGKWEEET